MSKKSPLPPADPDGNYVYPDGSKILSAKVPGRWVGRWKPKPGAPNGAYLRDGDGVVSYFRSPEAVAQCLWDGGEGPRSLPGYDDPPACPVPMKLACAHTIDPTSVKAPEGYDPLAEGGVVLTFTCRQCGATGNGLLPDGGSVEGRTVWDESPAPRRLTAQAWLEGKAEEWRRQGNVEELAAALKALAGEVADSDIQDAFFAEMEMAGYGRTPGEE